MIPLTWLCRGLSFGVLMVSFASAGQARDRTAWMTEAVAKLAVSTIPDGSLTAGTDER